MPRKMKKMDSMEAALSRQESVPGPVVEKKPRRESGKQMETFQKSFQKKYDQALAKFDDLEHLYKMEPTPENAAALEVARTEAEKYRLRLEKANIHQEDIDDSARVSQENKSVKATINEMADMIDHETKVKKNRADVEKRQQIDGMLGELKDIEENRMMEEEVLGYVEKPKKRVKKQETVSMNPRQEMVKELVELENENQKQEMARKEMESVEREWAERIKRDSEETEVKTSELQKQQMAKAESMQKAREASREALEQYKTETLPKLERLEVGERIQENVRAERASAETDPARKRSLAKLKKLEAEHAATGNRLRDLTGMEPEDAYEKLVLNGGFMTRIRRGLAKLANVPTYDLLDTWIESGKKLEEVDREVMGVKPDLMQSLSAKGKRQRIDVEEAAQQATDREFIAENPEVAAIDQDYKSGVVRNAEGAVIQDEKEIRAKRPMSRVPSRKVVMGSGGISDAMSRAEPVRLYQPGAESRSMPKVVKEEESVTLEFQKERAADINTVRKEYPRAAELWNSIAARMQGMEQDQFDALQEVFGTRDLATAYVLDRAFYDMDGDQEAKARIAEADKIMGIEEVSPKKVKPRLVKKAA
jgi:hypothetical protein